MRFKLTILHGNVALGSNPLFGGAPKVGDDDYEAERRLVDTRAKTED